MQAFTIPMRLQTHIRGLFVVQPEWSEYEFGALIAKSNVFWPGLCDAFQKDYAELSYVKGACIWQDEQTPWLILIIRDTRRLILSTGLHEIVHLADRITTGKENRALFVEHVYMAFADEVEKREGTGT